MKIFFLAGQFYPKIAGSATATYLIAKELARREHEVTVAVGEESRDLLTNVKLSFNIKHINSYDAFATGKAGFREATTEIYSILKNSSFDLVHVFSYMQMLLFSLIRDLFDFPVVFTFWNTPYKLERAVGFYENSELDLQLARSIIGAKKYNRIILGSRCYYNSALSLGADPNITDFSYHGVDINEFNNDLKNSFKVDLGIYFGKKLKPSDVLITLPGRIVPRKGMLEAIQALAVVNEARPSKLLLTGMAESYSTEFSQAVLHEATKLGIKEKILIPNRIIPRNHLPAIYKRSDIVITPSYYEGLCFTAIEALVAARPLVATSVPGLNEVVKDGENCLLVPPRNSQRLAESILKLLNNKNLASRLALAGPESVKKFDIKNFVDFLEATYAPLVRSEV